MVPLLRAIQKKIADLLGSIKTWGICPELNLQQITVAGIKFISYGLDEMRGHILFNLIATAFSNISTDVNLDYLTAVSPKISRLIFSPTLTEKLRINKDIDNFWGMYGKLITALKAYLFDEHACYAAAAICLENHITDDILESAGSDQVNVDAVLNVVRDMIEIRCEPELVVLQLQVTTQSEFNFSTSLAAVKSEVIEEQMENASNKAKKNSRKRYIRTLEKVNRIPALIETCGPAQVDLYEIDNPMYPFKDVVPMIEEAEYNTMPFADSGALKNDKFSRTYHFHSYKLYETQKLVLQAKPEWFHQIRARCNNSILDGGFNHFHNCIKARGDLVTNVFFCWL